MKLSSSSTDISAYTLFTMPANRSQRRITLLIGAILACVTLAAVP